MNETVLIKAGSHRARHKLFALVGKENTEALFSMRREVGHGGAFRIPKRFEIEAKEITGISGLRDGDDLLKCWDLNPKLRDDPYSQ